MTVDSENTCQICISLSLTCHQSVECYSSIAPETHLQCLSPLQPELETKKLVRKSLFLIQVLMSYFLYFL